MTMTGKSLVLSAVLVLSVLCAATATEESVIKGDLAFLQCPVCEETIKELVRKTSQVSKPKLTENAVVELVESVCDPSSPQGEWITKLDYKSKGVSVSLVSHKSRGQCKGECHTIAESCKQLLESSDMELVGSLYKGAKRSKLTKDACSNWNSFCGKGAKKLPKLPTDRQLGVERWEAERGGSQEANNNGGKQGKTKKEAKKKETKKTDTKKKTEKKKKKERSLQERALRMGKKEGKKLMKWLDKKGEKTKKYVDRYYIIPTSNYVKPKIESGWKTVVDSAVSAWGKAQSSYKNYFDPAKKKKKKKKKKNKKKKNNNA